MTEVPERPGRPAPVIREVRSADRLDDAALVALARGGDRWAEEVLFRRHARAVARVAHRLLGRRDEVEDVVQETFVTALSGLDRLRDPASVAPWLKRIAVHAVHRRFRRARLLRWLGIGSAPPDETEAVASGAPTPERLGELALARRVIDALPADERVVWLLRHQEGEGLAEVAALAGCSLATAKRRLARAEARIAEHVGVETARGSRRPEHGARAARDRGRDGGRGGTP